MSQAEIYTALDDDESLRSWSEIRAREPERIDAYLRPANILRDLGRFEEADTLLTEAIGRFPQAAEPLIEFAWVAHRARNWDEALARWERVRLKFVHPVGYTNASSTLVSAGRLEDADALLSQAIERFPDSRDCVHDHAWIALHGGRWQEALGRFQRAIARFPDTPTLYVGAASCLRKLQRHPEADLCLTEAVQRFPDDITLLRDWTAVACEQFDWETAFKRADLIASKYRDRPEGHTLSIHILTQMKDYVEAEVRSIIAMAKFPDNAEIYKSHAAIAAHRGLADEAAKRYRSFRERFPEHSYLPVSAITDWQAQPDSDAEIAKSGGCNVRSDFVERVFSHNRPQRVAQFGCGSARQAIEFIDIARELGWDLEVTCIDPRLKTLSGAKSFPYGAVCREPDNYFREFVDAVCRAGKQAAIVPVGGEIVVGGEITVMSIKIRNDGQKYDLIFIDASQIVTDVSLLIPSAFGLLSEGGALIVNCVNADGVPSVNARSALGKFSTDHFLGLSEAGELAVIWRDGNFPISIDADYLSTWREHAAPALPQCSAPAHEVCLAAITRNEAEMIAGMIRSAAPFISRAVFADNQSTDETVATIRATCDELGIPCEIRVTSKDRFDELRNEMLSLVPPTAEWVLVLDADERLSPRDLDLFAALINSENDLWALPRIHLKQSDENITVREGRYPDYQARLFRARRGLFYVNPVHEAVVGYQAHGLAPCYSSPEAHGGPHIFHLEAVSER